METIIFAIFGICCVMLIILAFVLRALNEAADVATRMYFLILKNSLSVETLDIDVRRISKLIANAQKDGDL